MSCTVDPSKLSDYVSKISDKELLEDLSHLFEVEVVTAALASTTCGKSYKLPISGLQNMTSAFKVYRDELAKRSTNSDRAEDASYTLLSEYYKCVKMVRSLSKYLHRITPLVESDFSRSYTDLFEHKASLLFSQSALET